MALKEFLIQRLKALVSLAIAFGTNLGFGASAPTRFIVEKHSKEELENIKKKGDEITKNIPKFHN